MTRTSTTKKSPRAEFGQLALGLFSGRSIGTLIMLRDRNRKLFSFDHLFGYRVARPLRAAKGSKGVGRPQFRRKR
jgi:hypothetical protein